MNWTKLLSAQRIKKSTPGDIRNEFESDFGRIIYSPALRRMHDKTQVFPLTTDDNIHSRLTHSNEVMSLGYTFGLKLSKSELIQKKTNKTECDLLRIMPILLQNVCFVHDIGNAPFGHFGETIVSDYFSNLKKQEHPEFITLSSRQQRDFLHYDGNAQGLRVLTKLQYLDNPFGLNLTFATLASFLKYPNFDIINSVRKKNCEREGEILKEKYIELNKHGVFESEEEYFKLIAEECELNIESRTLRHPLCYLMEAADSIAYNCMDMEDGFNKGLFTIEYIKNTFNKNTSAVAKKIVEICDNELLDPNTKIVNIRIKLIGYLVDHAYQTFEKKLEEIEAGKYNEELIKDDENGICKILEEFSYSKIFTCREINYLESTGYAVFKGLLDFYINFVFNSNEKYVKRAKSLISSSIINCAIEEDLISLCVRKNTQEKTKIEEEKVKFAKDAEYSNLLLKKLEKLQKKDEDFNTLRNVYENLFKKQFVSVLSDEELTNLRIAKKDILKLMNPQFEDLSIYFKFRVIIDFISGMTDQYALNHYQKISGQKIS